MPTTVGPSLEEEIAALVGGDPEGWGEAGGILRAVSDRLLSLQHDVHVLRPVNERLLAQLYPPNEVYVVARRPAKPEAADG